MEVTEAPTSVEKSETLCAAAASLMPGGFIPVPGGSYAGSEALVSSGWAPVMSKGKGAKLIDVDGNEYIDYIGGCGALILGHADERVVAAIGKSASKGFGFAAPTDTELRLAELIAARCPSIDMLRLVNTPSEAMSSAVACARAYTGRNVILTFARYDHPGPERERGVSGSTSAVRRGGPASPPVKVLPYNDLETAEGLFRDHGPTVAAVVVEPVATRTGLIPPADGFLHMLRSLCDTHGALLVFDETVTGFRIAPGGASTLYNVIPDLTVLGPIVGGGLPLAAYGGRKEVMKGIEKEGGPGQATHSREAQRILAHGEMTNEERRMSNSGSGVRRSLFDTRHSTFGTPCPLSRLAMAAGIATLQAIGEPDFHAELEQKAKRLEDGLRAATQAGGIAACHTRVASILGMRLLENADTPAAPDSPGETVRFTAYRQAMLERGILLPPSPVSCMFVSSAHSEEDIGRTIEAANDVLRRA